jgi:choline dehydrogenase
VLLLEAGGRDWNPIIQAPGGLLAIMMSGAHAWKYLSAPQRNLDNRALYTPRGKVLGGGSSINGMVYCRGYASDYDRWRAQGNAGWSYAEVLPYFKRAETYYAGASTYHGGDGPIQVNRPQVKHPLAQAFVAAGQQAGHPYNDDTNGREREGFGPVDVTVARGRRSSTANAYLRPARRRANLTVVTHAQATRVLFEDKRAVGVEYLRGGRRLQARADREVILSGGAINSPQLLMLSGVGDAGHLREHNIASVLDLKGVGQNLQDHLAVGVKYLATAPISMFKYFSPLKAIAAFGRYLLLRSGPLADPGMEAVAFVKSQPGLPEPDIKFTFVMALYSNNGRDLTPRHGFSAHINVARPESVGEVRLASADPLAPPIIDQNYHATENDRRALCRGVQIAREVFQQIAFDPYRGEELEPGAAVTADADIDAFIRAKAEADYHSVGTCKMGNDALAVVDEQLRVRGLSGLRVVDASIMPGIIGGNTNMAVIMIAEKAADMILGKPAPAAQDLSS